MNLIRVLHHPLTEPGVPDASIELSGVVPSPDDPPASEPVSAPGPTTDAPPFDQASRVRWEALLRDRQAQHKRELEERDQRADALEREYKEALKERELATALVGRPLLPGAAGQLIRLWRDELEVVATNGKRRVQTRDGRPVEQAVNEWLTSAEYAHFRQPGTRGGTLERGSNPASMPGAPAVKPPKTLGEAVLLRWRESMEQFQLRGSTAPGLSGKRR